MTSFPQVALEVHQDQGDFILLTSSRQSWPGQELSRKYPEDCGGHLANLKDDPAL